MRARAFAADASDRAARGLAPYFTLAAAADWPGWVASTSLAM